MNTNLKTVLDFGMRQKLVQFGVQVVGNVVTGGVVVFLFLAWMFTSPFLRLIDQVAGGGKVNTKNK
jgi:hypothetical protein